MLNQYFFKIKKKKKKSAGNSVSFLCLSVLIQELNKLGASCVFYVVTCSFLYTHKSWNVQESDRTTS